MNDKNIWFQKRLDEVFGSNRYLLMNDYINTKTEVTVKHLECGTIFNKKPLQLLQKYGCKVCSKRVRISNDVFDSMLGEEYTRLEECVNNRTPVLIRHNCEKCNNYEYKVRPSNFQQGKRCPKCSGLLKKDISEIQEFLDLVYPNEYTIIGEYINKDTPIEIKHNTCGNIIKVSWNNIRSKKFGCKYCIMSSGEMEVASILKELKIDYNYQYIIEDCKDKKPLPFDFQFMLDGKMYIIEYDGRQHFMEIFGRNSIDKKNIFETTKRHDNIKNNYCKENNINILRIKYDETNIKSLIEEFIS